MQFLVQLLTQFMRGVLLGHEVFAIQVTLDVHDAIMQVHVFGIAACVRLICGLRRRVDSHLCFQPDIHFVQYDVGKDGKDPQR